MLSCRTVPLLLSGVIVLTACAGDDISTPDECLAHCEFLQGCGATPQTEDCESLCEALTDVPVYSAPCRECMSEQCGQVAACISDDAVCGAPSVSITATLSGLTGEAEAHVALALWDGTPTGFVASKGATAPETSVLTLGHAAKPGVSYQIQYYIDSNEDSVCEPGADLTGAGSLYISEPSSLIYWLGDDAEEVDTCAAFPSKDALCEDRCAETARCGVSSADCVAVCGETATRVVRDCMACQDSRSCDEQATACYQPGGACEEGYIPPTVQLLLGPDGSFYEPDDVGKLVYAKVRNAAGRVLGEAPPIESREGGFVINFGEEILWENQTYTATFYLDRNEDEVCNGDDPVIDTIVEVGTDVALIYATLNTDNIAPSTCEIYDAP